MVKFPAQNFIDQDLSALKSAGKNQDPQAVKAAAEQFESVYIKMMLSSMREASLGDPLFPGETTVYRDLYDHEMATQLSANGGMGIADLLVEQLKARSVGQAEDGVQPALAELRLNQSRPVLPTLPHVPEPENLLRATNDPEIAATPKAADSLGFGPVSISEEIPIQNINDPRHAFVAKIWPQARKAAAELGVAPEIIVAQAALETGWGKSQLSSQNSNLFGIKASANWGGAKSAYPTAEYVDGRKTVQNGSFRSYDSIEQSFADYVNLLKTSPRYAEALKVGHDSTRFAHALQQAGYATDPQYARKVLAIANGFTMKGALAQIQPAMNDKV